MIWWYRWASWTGHMGIALVSECERDGYHIVGADPRYPDSVLMRRDEVTSERQASEESI